MLLLLYINVTVIITELIKVAPPYYLGLAWVSWWEKFLISSMHGPFSRPTAHPLYKEKEDEGSKLRKLSGFPYINTSQFCSHRFQTSLFSPSYNSRSSRRLVLCAHSYTLFLTKIFTRLWTCPTDGRYNYYDRLQRKNPHLACR